jgi:Fic family protein
MIADKPFNALPKLPPKADLETPTILNGAIRANRELAQLKGYCALLPNESILLNSIIVQEARASSEIENIVTTHDKLYQAMVVDHQSVDAATKEVLNYRAAVWAGLDLLRQSGYITTNTIVAIQRVLEENDAGIRKLPGTSLVNDVTGETIYTPPDDERTIRDLMRNLENYLNTVVHSVDPLVRMAVAHYQFESIHPFYDGNGRTGRIVNVLYLVKERLIDSPILYLSRNIIREKGEYYRLLQSVRTEGDWQAWVLFMLRAVEVTAADTLAMIRQIVEMMNETIEVAKEKLPRTSYSKELIETVFAQPYTKIEHLVQRDIAERRTASKYLKQLEDLGVLQSIRVWKQQIYINHRLMELLRRSA